MTEKSDATARHQERNDTAALGTETLKHTLKDKKEEGLIVKALSYFIQLTEQEYRITHTINVQSI